MSFLDKVESGKKPKPYFLIIYGPDGVGKSTFGADAPSPIFLCAESGTNHLDVSRFPEPRSFSDVLAMVDELLQKPDKYQTLVVDSLDWIEPLVWTHVCKMGGKENIEDFGYGKGYTLALLSWQTLLSQLKALREKMNIILIGHAEVKTFQDPVHNSGYDRYQLKLNQKAAALFREAVDAVLFATYEVFTKKDGQKTRAFGEGARILFTERRPGHDAKNRMQLPYQIPLSWDDFVSSAENESYIPVEALKSKIEEMLTFFKDPILEKKVLISAATADPVKLNKIIEKLNIKMEALDA